MTLDKAEAIVTTLAARLFHYSPSFDSLWPTLRKYTFFLFLWSSLACLVVSSVLVPGTLAFYFLYLDKLRLFALLCLTAGDHIICISL